METKLTYEKRPNSGALFKNDRKTGPKQPDYTGNWVDEGGREWRLAAWLKDGKRGKFFSVTASEKLQSGADKYPPAPSTPSTKREPDPFDDEIPF